MPAFTPHTWTIVIGSDRAYYEGMQSRRSLYGPSVEFPAQSSERRLLLSGKQMRIGRRSVARSLRPEIDLADPPADPGVSRLHAVLIATADGSWGVLDPGSANGTLLNGREIPVGDLVPLQDGDRIYLGAWTVITVRRG
ncbi:MAG: FHA domain-containing protein [Streptosporangiaceae bacterium]